ncbi:hypothetical protein [Acinetobacter indicus]
MKSSLQTMQGMSDAIRTVAETIANEVIPERKNFHDDTRTELEDSFEGSYGQNFRLVTCSENAKQKFNELGEPVVVEIIKYYLSEALFQDYPKLSPSASKFIDKLGTSSESLIQKLRNGTLQRVHTVPNTLHYDVSLHHKTYVKEEIKEVKLLQTFDKETYAVLVPKKSKKIINISIAITRFNIFTGNGRCKVKGDNTDKIIAFGFISYKALKPKVKKIFSQNLDSNNGLDDEEVMHYINVSARELIKRDGEVVKYIIESVII